MRPLTVIVAHADLASAIGLAASLQSHFKCTFPVDRSEDLREAIVRHHANLVIVDLDLMPLGEVAALRRDFPASCFVCTHCDATEDMADSARTAGCEGCWRGTDVRSIVLAACANVGRWGASA
jgi:hypothetical protein